MCVSVLLCGCMCVLVCCLWNVVSVCVCIGVFCLESCVYWVWNGFEEFSFPLLAVYLENVDSLQFDLITGFLKSGKTSKRRIGLSIQLT